MVGARCSPCRASSTVSWARVVEWLAGYDVDDRHRDGGRRGVEGENQHEDSGYGASIRYLVARALRRWRHRLGAGLCGFGAVHDARPGPVLRRHGAQQARAGHARAELRLHRRGQRHLVPGGLQPGVQRGRRWWADRESARSRIRPRQLTATSGIALTVPQPAFAAFQMMFAVITAALLTGAGARPDARFGSFLVFASTWVLLVYIPIAHWVFSPYGWLAKHGIRDFLPSGTVVEINAGASGARARTRARQTPRLAEGANGAALATAPDPARCRRSSGSAGSASTQARHRASGQLAAQALDRHPLRQRVAGCSAGS